jgi:hypothetical protein
MALDDLGLELDFPTLIVAGYWVERHCVVPDGVLRGESFGLVRWQAEGLLNWYRLKSSARVGQLAPAFFYRRSQVVLPQKAGKAPYSAAHICNEAVGPALFAGWARGGEVWDCRDHGCGCGWAYEYGSGEAMGRPWSTPLIQVTAFSDTQAHNIYDALKPMIDEGPLSTLIPHTGEEFIRLPNDGRIDVVTSSHRSRLGQRVTFVPQDETGVWTQAAGMIKVAETQRRGLAGMGGRAEETTNAWDPNEDSVAQRTALAARTSPDIFRIHPMPARSLSYRNKQERRKIHRHVYDGCPWVDLDAIEAEAAELITVDPGQAERFFGNRPVAGMGAAFDLGVWESLEKKVRVERHATVVIGVDGARHDDALAVVACDVKSGHMWPLVIVERPENAPEDYEHDQSLVDGAVSEAFERFNVWRLYADPQHIAPLIESWSNRYGSKRVIEWATYRPRAIAFAVRAFEEGIAAGDVSFSDDEAGRLTKHIVNAYRRTLTVRDDKEAFMHTLSKEAPRSPNKMDAAMAAVLAWEARGDALASGAVSLTDTRPQEQPKPPRPYEPGFAPNVPALVGGWSPGGDME